MPEYDIVVDMTEEEQDELSAILGEPTHMARISFSKTFVLKLLQETFDTAYSMGIHDGGEGVCTCDECDPT